MAVLLGSPTGNLGEYYELVRCEEVRGHVHFCRAAETEFR